MEYLEPIRKYIPYNEQEEKDQLQILEYEKLTSNLLIRDNKIAHITASSIVLNPARDKTLMVYHNIWKDWCWTGGHVDGNTDFLKVAIKELQEETGIRCVTPIIKNIVSLDIIPAWGHYKNGQYIVAHQHINVTYLLEVSDKENLFIKQDENEGVKWIKINKYKNYSRQKTMYPIYDKILEKIGKKRL